MVNIPSCIARVSWIQRDPCQAYGYIANLYTVVSDWLCEYRRLIQRPLMATLLLCALSPIFPQALRPPVTRPKPNRIVHPNGMAISPYRWLLVFVCFVFKLKEVLLS